MINVEDFLKSNNIDYGLHEHPAVFTCKEANKYCSNIPWLACKNLFLKDNKSKRFILLIIPASKRTELNKFAEIIWEKRVSFASPELLKEKLWLEPWAVSPFWLLNDKNNEVELYIDKEVLEAIIVSFHPNRNTATLELSKNAFQNFLNLIWKQLNVISC